MSLQLDKSRTEYHKRIVASIGDALKVTSYANIPRISPLGRDIDGRIYWALTPGMNEREDALDLLQSYSQGRTHKSSRSRRNPLVPSEEDRSALRKWSWFVAVWGKRPPTAERALVEDDSEDEDDDDGDDEEQWWGFWEPDEITKLASWVHFKADFEDIPEQMFNRSVRVPSGARPQSPESDVDMEDPADDKSSDDELNDDDMEVSMIPTKDEIVTLVEELEQYASLLRGRIKRNEETEDSRPVRR